MTIENNPTLKYQKKNSNSIYIFTIIILVVGIGFLAFLLLKGNNLSSSSTQNSSNSSKNDVNTSSNNVSNTPIQQISTTPIVTESVTPTTSESQSFKDNEYDISFTYPSEFTVDTDATVDRDCNLSSDYLKTSCSGQFKAEKLQILSKDKNSNGGYYGITFTGATSGIGGGCSGSGSKISEYYATVKGTKYIFQTCQVSSGDIFATTNMNITGADSKWKTAKMDFSAKDRDMIMTFLDLFVSIK